MVRTSSGDEADEPAAVPVKRRRMTLEEASGNNSRKGGKKGRVSVAQRLQTNAQLSPRSQEDPDERVAIVKQPLEVSKYDKATIRIIAQFLDNIGLKSSVEALVEETGFKIETSAGARIRANIKKGNYDAAGSILKQARDLPPTIASHAAYIIQCFKLADLVRKGRYFDAMFTMKSMAPTIYADGKKNRWFFNSFIKNVMLAENNYQNLDSVTERESQLTFLEELLPTDFILPQNRLKTILNKVHGPSADEKSGKLLRDEVVTSQKVAPYKEVQHIQDNQKRPIYRVKFSTDGRLMASAGRMNCISVWDVRRGQVKKYADLEGNTDEEIGQLEFCQQNRFLLVCCAAPRKGNLIIFCVSSRSMYRTLRTYNGREELIEPSHYFTCATFLTEFNHPSGPRTRVVAGNEQGCCKIFDMGIMEHLGPQRQLQGFRIRCLYGLKNGDSFLTVDHMNRVRYYSLSQEKMEGTTICKEEVMIMGLTVHPSERLLLTSTEASLRLWDIRNHQLIRVFTGACSVEQYNRYQISTSFGGPNHQYIVSGSIGEETIASLNENDKDKRKNGRVVIWSIDESRPKFEIPGHTGHVNGAAWNPNDPTMLASCGEDGTVRIWHLNRAETLDHSEVVPRRMTREEKLRKRADKAGGGPSTSRGIQEMLILREQVKRMSTNTEFETDLNMEQLWIDRCERPKFVLDEEKHRDFN